jgi:hypothetical protein
VTAGAELTAAGRFRGGPDCRRLSRVHLHVRHATVWAPDGRVWHNVTMDRNFAGDLVLTNTNGEKTTVSKRGPAFSYEFAIDLSSASVMVRQVLEDTISFFYLSEPCLTKEQKEFSLLYWYKKREKELTGTGI